MPEVPGSPSRYVVTATMDDVPHLPKDAQEAILASMPEHQREARRTGVPSLGVGAIFGTIAEADITVSDFDIPAHWPRGYGMDTGWKATAAVFAALNRETDVMFIYDCYKRGFAEPAAHAQAILARGKWLSGFADAADINRIDGKSYLQIYRELGLDIQLPDKRSVEANILAVHNRMSSGRLKIFKSCTAWFDEFRIYRRDENGQIVRANDHLMASTQYRVKAPVLSLRVNQPQTRLDHRNSNRLPDSRGDAPWMS